METRAHYVAVGAFVLMTIFLAFVAVVWLAGAQFTVVLAHYYIYFDGPVSGLNNGAKVEYNGIPVGTVTDIGIVTDKEELAREKKQIRVTVEIKSEIQIKKDAAATLQTNILSGVSYILISPGKSQELLEARKDQRYPVIRSRRSTFSSLAARGPQLLDKLDVILDHIDDVLSDHNRAAFSSILDNVQTISGDLTTVSVDMKTVSADLKKLSGGDLKAIGENLRKASDTLAQHAEQLIADAGTALKSAASLFTDLDQSYTQPNGLKDQVSVALGDFDKLVKGLSDTNRQLGQAVADVRPGLRNFSQKTLTDVDALIGEVRQVVSGIGRIASQFERDPQRVLFGDRREGYQPK
jgi:phospholipid/cholesterol/gamma-HCH transport system substrate-binding protein